MDTIDFKLADIKLESSELEKNLSQDFEVIFSLVFTPTRKYIIFS